MTTVREFTDRMWYAQKMLIIKWRDFEIISCDIMKAAKEKAIYIGTPHELRSEVYADVNKRIIDSYGVVDNTLIIEVH